MFVLISLAVVAIFSQSAAGLECFNCINVEVDSSSPLYNILKGKSDPNCGVMPTSSNTVTCPSGSDYKCGAFHGKVSSQLLGDAKIEILGCVIDSSAGGCSKDASKISELLNVLLKFISTLGVTLSGDVCTCSWNMCVLCDGGVSIAGYCMKYWMLALVGGGSLLAFILLITCCCCCGCCGCCCCRKRQSQGVIIQTNVPYRTLTTSGEEGVYTTTTGGISVQSGDIVGYTRPVAYTGPQYA